MADFNPFNQGAIPLDDNKSEDFNPFSQGAIPTKEGGFDPFKAGAIPLDSTKGEVSQDKPVVTEGKDPTFISTPLTPAEIADIATKHNISNPEDIKSLLTHTYLRGGTVEGETRPVEYAVGLASDMFLPGPLPAFAQKKLADNPNLREAMDDIADIVQQKRSYTRAIGAPIAGAVATLGGGAALRGAGLLAKGAEVAEAASTGATIAKGAGVGVGLGAVGGVAGSKEGEEIKEGLIGGAVGGVLGGAIGAGTEYLTKRKEIKLEAARKQLEQVLDESVTKETAPKAMQVIEEAVEKYTPESRYAEETLDKLDLLKGRYGDVEKIPDSIKSDKIGLANFYKGRMDNPIIHTIEDADNVIDTIIHNNGYMKASELYSNFKLAEAGELGERLVKRARMDERNLGVGQYIQRVFEGAMHMADRIDRATGSHFNSYINEYSMQYNQFKNVLVERMEALKPIGEGIAKEAKELGISYTDANKALYDYLDQRPNPLSDKISDGLKKETQKWFEDTRQLYNNTVGEEVIKKWGGPEGTFITHRTKDPTKAVGIIQREADRLESDVPEFADLLKKSAAGEDISIPSAIEALPTEHHEAVKDLVLSVERVTGKRVDTVDDMVRAVDGMSTDAKNIMQIGEMEARSAKARTGGTPDLIKEFDIMRLGESYTSNTMKQAYVGSSVSKLKAELMALANAGIDKHYIEDMSNLITDIQGNGRHGTLAQSVRDTLSTFEIRERITAAKAEAAGQNVKASIHRALASAPDALAYLGNQVYPNTLGIFVNQRSPIKNLFQPFMTTSPEIGYTYGIPKATRGMTYALRHPKLAAQELDELGLHGSEWGKVLQSTISDPTIGKQWRALAKVNSSVANMAMLGFEISETANRYAAKTMGFAVAEDLVSAMSHKNKLSSAEGTALEYLQNMMDSGRRDTESLLQQIRHASGDERAALQKQLGVTISQSLIQKTVIDYNKANASIFARSMPAPLIVFTKYPTILAGNLMHTIETKGYSAALTPIMKSYIAPFMVAALTDKVSEEVMDDDANLLKFVLGKGGVKDVTNLGGLLSLRNFGNPMLLSVPSGLFHMASGLSTGDDKEFERAKQQVISGGLKYTPSILSGPIQLWQKVSDMVED